MLVGDQIKMKLLCIILTSFLVIDSWGCIKKVTSADGISQLPILAFINDNDRQIEFRLHLRKTGRFERLSGVGLTIQNEDETTSQCLFHGYMELLDVAKMSGIKTVTFYLQKDLIQKSILEIYVPKMTTNGLHGVSYEVPVNLIHEHFSDNITAGLPAGSTRDGPEKLVAEFLSKEFATDDE